MSLLYKMSYNTYDVQKTKNLGLARTLKPIGWLVGKIEHHNTLIRAVYSAPTTPVARTTLGQIADGFILYEALLDKQAGYPCLGLPLDEHHSELSTDVLSKMGEFLQITTQL